MRVTKQMAHVCIRAKYCSQQISPPKPSSPCGGGGGLFENTSVSADQIVALPWACCLAQFPSLSLSNPLFLNSSQFALHTTPFSYDITQSLTHCRTVQLKRPPLIFISIITSGWEPRQPSHISRHISTSAQHTSATSADR